MQASYIAERVLGYQQITDVSASTALTIPPGTVLILVTPLVAPVRYRDDGTAPTAAVGYPLAVGVELQYTAQQAAQLRFIQQSAGAELNVLYYG